MHHRLQVGKEETLDHRVIKDGHPTTEKTFDRSQFRQEMRRQSTLKFTAPG